MSKQKTFMYAMLLFVSGAVLGGSLTGVGISGHWFRGFHGPRPPLPEVIMERLERDLGLSAQQQRELLPIIEELNVKFEALRRESRPRMERIIDEAQERAEPLLSEAQREELRRLRDRAREHFERRRGRH